MHGMALSPPPAPALQIVLPHFKSLCCTAMDVVAEGMRAAGQAITSAHFAAAHETVRIMTRLQLRVRMVVPEGYTKADPILHEMGQAALQAALAGIDATEAQQAQVLSAESLKLGEPSIVVLFTTHSTGCAMLQRREDRWLLVPAVSTTHSTGYAVLQWWVDRLLLVLAVSTASGAGL